MADVVDKATRSRMMSGIRSKNTKPEMRVRSLLHRDGFRFRLHQAGLPGKPDLILKKYHALIFVHGCFWHCHKCKMFKWPKANREFWRKKISGNKARDRRQVEELIASGWRVMTIWECSLRGPNDKGDAWLLRQIREWLFSALARKEV